MSTVSISMTECTPMPETSVDSLMPVSCTTHGIRKLLVFRALCIQFGDDLLLSLVSKIPQGPFGWTKFTLGPVTEDVEIWPLAGRKRTIVSNNITCGNASDKFV